MTEILFFEGSVKYDTDWDYATTCNKMKEQKCEVLLTGGSWILISKKIERWFSVIEYHYFYEIDFIERKSDSKCETVTKCWSSKYETPNDLKGSEILWSIKNQAQNTQSEFGSS